MKFREAWTSFQEVIWLLWRFQKTTSITVSKLITVNIMPRKSLKGSLFFDRQNLWKHLSLYFMSCGWSVLWSLCYLSKRGKFETCSNENLWQQCPEPQVKRNWFLIITDKCDQCLESVSLNNHDLEVFFFPLTILTGGGGHLIIQKIN